VAEPRGPVPERWITGACAAALLALYAGLCASYATGHFSYKIDYDNYLGDALALIEGKALPLLGPWVVPTDFRLGPAFIWLLGLVMALTGGRALWMWALLLSLNGLAIVLLFHRFSGWVGRQKTMLLCLFLAGCPLLHQTQQVYFWHAQYGLLFTVLWTVSLLRWRLEGRGADWLWAAGSAALALQFHFTALVLLPPLAVLGFQGRKSLSPKTLAASALLFAALSSYAFLELSQLFDLGAFIALTARHASGYEPFAFKTLVSWCGPFGVFNAALFIAGLGLAAGSLLQEERDGKAAFESALAVLILSGAASLAALYLALRHRWHPHYGLAGILFLLLPQFLALDHLTGLLGKGVRNRGGWVQAAVLGLLLAASARVPGSLMDWTSPARPVEDYSVLKDAVDQAGGARLHGFLCDFEDKQPLCKVRYLRGLEARRRGAGAHSAAGRAVRYDGKRFVSVPAAVPAGKARYLNAVLFEGSSCGEDVRPPAARSGKTEVPMVPVFSLGNLDTPSCLRGYRTRSAFGPDRDRPLLQVPPGAELLDEFESEHEYSRQSWGLGSLGV